jgi:hypothetical protein
MADTMESQVSGEGGMNRVVSEASSKIRDHLMVATSTIDKGEQNWHQVVLKYESDYSKNQNNLHH